MSSNIMKIWGERRRILLTDRCEIDLLYLKKDSFCSRHKHKDKTNKFVVVKGKVRIETEFGKKILTKNQSFEVKAPLIHRFFALKNSIMVELAYVEEGYIIPDDIKRFKQGGRVVNGKEMTEDKMRKKRLLD